MRSVSSLFRRLVSILFSAVQSAHRNKNKLIKPSFHVIAHDRRIAENTASDRQRLYGNTFQRPVIVGDRERSYASLIPAMVSGREQFELKKKQNRNAKHLAPYMYCKAVFRGELPLLCVKTVFESQITVP